MSETIWSLDTAKRRHRHSPAIAKLLATILPKTEPVLDLGCGLGTYLKALANEGFRCLGVEGTPEISTIAHFSEIVEADLSRPLSLSWPQSSVLCLEVAEHLRPEEESVLVDSIDRYCSGRLVLSWAISGQRGTGHINCQPNSYVYRTLRNRGFELMPEPTFLLREAAEDAVRYFRQSLLVFSRP